MTEFAARGLAGGSVATIAAQVGVSQSYVFQLFGTKRRLFLVTVGRGFRRFRQQLAETIEPGDVGNLKAMFQAWKALAVEGVLLPLQVQACAASCSDEDVRAEVQILFAGLWRFVEDNVLAGPEDVEEFFAQGMLVNVLAALNSPGDAPPKPKRAK
jgi:AcrR family transcriptional regulator